MGKKHVEPRCAQAQCQAPDIKTKHSGYVKHRKAGETPCQASLVAHREYVAARRAFHLQHLPITEQDTEE